MSRDAGVGFVAEAPDDGEPYVRQGSVWVHHPFGSQYEQTPFNVTPLLGTVVFQTYVTQTYTPDLAGLYEATPFMALTASSGNGKAEVRITVTLLPSTIVFQSIIFSKTASAADDVENITGHLPILLTTGTYEFDSEFRQPTSPGTLTALQGGTQINRVA